MSEHESATQPTTAGQRTMGGHGAGAVAELHPHLRPIDVYWQMTAEKVDEDSDEKMWGRMVEPLLLQWAELKLGGPIRSTGTERFYSQQYPWLHASPDGFFDGATPTDLGGVYAVAGLVSAKHVGMHRARWWGRAFSDHVPDYANIQEQTYMGIVGAQFSHVVAAVGGRPPELWAVPFSDRAFGAILEMTDAFVRRHVIPRVPPPPDGSSRYKRWIQETLVESPGELVAVAEEDELHHVIDTYRKQAAEFAAVNREMQKADQALRCAIGERTGLVLPTGEKVTYRTNRKGVRTLLVPRAWKGADDGDDA